jgi:hypothetical protein
MLLHVRQHGLERIGLQQRVGIEDEDVPPPRLGNPDVVCSPEPDVALQRNPAHLRELRRQRLNGAIGGGIVHNQNLRLQPLQRLQYRTQALAQ